jgi:hypothetical protein
MLMLNLAGAHFIKFSPFLVDIHVNMMTAILSSFFPSGAII